MKDFTVRWAATVLGCTASLLGSCQEPSAEELGTSQQELEAELCDASATTLRGRITLDYAIEGQQSYDFSEGHHEPLHIGDFYWYAPTASFIANNVGQRGTVSVGACDSIGDVVIPDSGYTRGETFAQVGHCYVALLQHNERGNVVFRVDAINGSQVSLFYTVVPSAARAITLDYAIEGQQSYDFSEGHHEPLHIGDFYWYAPTPSFIANNLGQRGVMSVGPCGDLASVAIPTQGYSRGESIARVGECYVALTQHQERDHIVFKVTKIEGSKVDLDYILVENDVEAITLDYAIEGQQSYDFSEGHHEPLHIGDFYWYAPTPSFIANNIGQRGVMSVGPCGHLADVAIPTQGYSRGESIARVGECYVALTQHEERDHIVFKVTKIEGSKVDLDCLLVESGIEAITLDYAIEGQQSYDFSEGHHEPLHIGDFYWYAPTPSFIANNLGQRGVMSVGPCGHLSDVVIPSQGYSRGESIARVGECYVALTQHEERDHIVFKVTKIEGSKVDLDYILVENAVTAITLDYAIEGQQSYDFSEGHHEPLHIGDFYWYAPTPSFIANNIGQRGVMSVGPCGHLSEVAIPAQGYSRGESIARVGECYVALTQHEERDHIVFKVTKIEGSKVDLDYLLVESNVEVITLDYAIEGRQSYDFSEGHHVPLHIGDFYWYSPTTSFIANNISQRGTVSVGRCNDLASVVIPTQGYTRGETIARVGECYVALAQHPECDHIVFQVTAIQGTTVTIESVLASKRPARPPLPEICDGADNDQDARIDEGVTRACGTDVGECSVGVETCSAGTWLGCTATTPVVESCDQRDNDCDALSDEGGVCAMPSCGGPFVATAQQHVTATRAYTTSKQDCSRCWSGCTWPSGCARTTTSYFAVGSGDALGTNGGATFTLYKDLLVSGNRYALQCFEPLLCGNGALNSLEECDDGNANDGDGCSSACAIEDGAVCGPPGTPCRFETEVFFEGFGSGLGRWTETGEGDWNTEALGSNSGYPATGSGAPGAHSDGCGSSCTIATASSFDLRGSASGRLEYLRRVGSALDSGEYLEAQVWNGSAWVRAHYFTDRQGDDDVWRRETLNLAPYLGVSNFKVRFVTKQSSTLEHVHIDDVRIVLTR